jgi:formamidopyrimidine-DNA glycosylase
MPELPEVEMQCQLLSVTSLHKTIEHVTIFDDFVVKGVSQEMFQHHLRGAQIIGIARRGKFIEITTNTTYDLAIHLGMTGHITYSPSHTPIQRYARVVLTLTNNYDLRYHSKRKLGGLYLVTQGEFTQIPTIKSMGPEPLSPKFDFSTFLLRVQGKTAKVKTLLLNQKFIAGIGNIYGDEILYQAMIHPDRKITDLTIEELRRLHNKIIDVLSSAIHRRADFPTINEKTLIPNRNEKATCPRCGCPIHKLRIASRTSYYCKKCQR